MSPNDAKYVYVSAFNFEDDAQLEMLISSDEPSEYDIFDLAFDGAVKRYPNVTRNRFLRLNKYDTTDSEGNITTHYEMREHYNWKNIFVKVYKYNLIKFRKEAEQASE